MTDKMIDAREKALFAPIRERNKGTIIGCYKVMTDEEKKLDNELCYRRMISRCLAYGEGYYIHDDMESKWGKHGLSYGVEKLGEERAMEIWAEERDFFKAHAKIHWGIHTDYEGCTYNSVEWDEYALSLT